MKQDRYTVTLEQDEQGELVLPLPMDLLQQLGWNVGDTLNWEQTDSESFVLSKKVE